MEHTVTEAKMRRKALSLAKRLIVNVVNSISTSIKHTFPKQTAINKFQNLREFRCLSALSFPVCSVFHFERNVKRSLLFDKKSIVKKMVVGIFLCSNTFPTIKPVMYCRVSYNFFLEQKCTRFTGCRCCWLFEPRLRDEIITRDPGVKLAFVNGNSHDVGLQL